MKDLVQSSLKVVGVTEYSGPPCGTQSGDQDVCLNGGTCIARLDNFDCICVPPYTGHACSSSQSANLCNRVLSVVLFTFDRSMCCLIFIY